MGKLIVFGLLFLTSCGTDNRDKPVVIKSSSNEPAATPTPQPDPDQKSLAATVVGATEISPISYTFLDTPDANLCVDAFVRQGISLPAETVARTLNVYNVRSNGISVQDMGQSPIPVLTILRINNNCSDTTFQLLNPVGFYCIVRNAATFSNVTIQRSCTAKIAELEPATHTTVNSAPAKQACLFGIFCGLGWGKEYPGTQSSYNSSITETPCIP